MSDLAMLSAVNPRSLDEIAAAAHAVQANVFALKTAWCKRAGQDEKTHDIRTPSPGAVHKARELLIDWRTIRDYGPEEVALRLRQAWGEFCALCWLFPHVDPQAPMVFDPLPPAQGTQCFGEVAGKLAEVQRGLWRILHEQRLRSDTEASRDPIFREAHEIAVAMPLKIYGENISSCGNDELLSCACEYAGMLAALRWATDDRWKWEAPGIMDVTLPAIA
jgi:hypothetical protein